LTWVIAHRGASRDFPENTSLAFDEALRQGCDAIELDVQLTRDGVPVIWHDRTLARAGGGRRKVGWLDLADVTGLDGAAGWPHLRRRLPLLTLDEALDRYAQHTTLLVELKARDAPGGSRDLQLARVATDLLRRGRWLDRTLVLCFDPLVLEACKQVDARVRTVLNLDPPPRLNAALRARLAPLDMLSTNVRTLTPAFGRAVADCGKPLLVYTCNVRVLLLVVLG
jgi:glycerophosphoryl diester phosphodiesterase